MRLLSITTIDMGALGRRHLDMTKLPDGLIGVAGANGTGKSTLLELSCPGALFRTLPSRSPSAMVDLAKSRNARVEAIYDHGGHEFRILHMLDGEKRKGEAHIYCDGEPYRDGNLVSNGKVRVFDKLVAKLWPSWPLVAMSRFWAQKGAGSWEEVPASASGKTDRRDILRELLGLHQMQAVADVAAKQSREVTDTDTTRLEDAVGERRVAAESLAMAQGRKTSIDLEMPQVHESITATESQLSACRRALAGVAAADQLATHGRVSAELTQLRSDRALEFVGLAPLQGEKDRAVRRLDDARAARELAVVAQAAYVAADAKARRLGHDLATARSTAGDHRPDMAKMAADWKHQKACVSEMEGRREADIKCEADQFRCKTDLAGSERRAGLLADVPCGGSAPYDVCPLLKDAVQAKAKVPGLVSTLNLLRSTHNNTTQAGLASTRAELDRITAAGTAARAQSQAWADVDRLAAELDAARAAVGEPHAVPSVATFEASVRDVTADIQRVRQAVSAMDGRIEGMDRQLQRLPSLESLRAQVDGAGWDGPGIDAMESQLTRLRSQLRSLETQLIAASTEVGIQSAVMARTETAAADLAEAEAANEDARVLREHLARIKHAFGPRGMQSVLIDAAGPAIAETSTALLEHAYGSRRFTVSIRTTAELKSGDGHRDVMEAVIYDAETDHSGPLENLSGGERDMVRAALAIGIAQHHSESSGVTWETAWSDEAGAALHGANSARWVVMMRQACVRLGIRQLLLVTHDEEVQRGLDHLIHVDELTE